MLVVGVSENRHTADDLREMQSLPLELKLALTKDRIKAWYREYCGEVYVSRSGGKDSDVLGDIVKSIYPDVPQVYIQTGAEWESVMRHGREVADNVLYPKISFMEVIKKYGYPVLSKEVSQKISDARSNPFGVCAKRFTDCEHNRKYSQYSMERYQWLLDAPFKISHNCCNIVKKDPAKKYEKETGRKAFIGTLADESKLRRTEWLKNGCNAFDNKRPVSRPLSFWTENDILQYIKERQLQIADIYGDIVYEKDGFFYDYSFGNTNLTTTGAKRTGCVWCLFGITQDKERFLRLKATEPKKYDFVINGGHFENNLWTPDENGLGYWFVIQWINLHGNMKIHIENYEFYERTYGNEMTHYYLYER